ncbi:unnamed protein product [Arctia plantaginis]|uniref:Uncharacterized protein n=1 Tax=Arctia plantaginis TaxID=874455 RepID=A0A8S1AZC7_ARCPL|nr:unnamed protein product [Arctia plantaginis]CAB3250789.1 unnamed protein product [Arctia plantaginis]
MHLASNYKAVTALGSSERRNLLCLRLSTPRSSEELSVDATTLRSLAGNNGSIQIVVKSESIPASYFEKGMSAKVAAEREREKASNIKAVPLP